MGDDFIDNALNESATLKRRRRLRRPNVIAAMILGVGGPFAIYESRGPCWETLLVSLVVFSIALFLVRPRFSVWLANI